MKQPVYDEEERVSQEISYLYSLVSFHCAPDRGIFLRWKISSDPKNGRGTPECAPFETVFVLLDCDRNRCGMAESAGRTGYHERYLLRSDHLTF